jgi:hypothetical protein
LDKGEVGGEKVEKRQFRRRDPAVFGYLQITQFSAAPATAVGNDHDRPLVVSIIDDIKEALHPDSHIQLFLDLPHYGLPRIFIFFHLTAGELPKERVRNIILAAGDENFAVVQNNTGGDKQREHENLVRRENLTGKGGETYLLYHSGSADAISAQTEQYRQKRLGNRTGTGKE